MRLLSMWTAVALAGPMATSQELPLDAYLELLQNYADGADAHAVSSLQSLDRSLLADRNAKLSRVLDLDRPQDKRLLLSAVLLHAEAAVSERLVPAADFFLDEAMSLTPPFGEAGGSEIQKKVHLAVVYRAYHERRVVDALRMAAPAAERFSDDARLQLALGTLAEIVGWLHGSREVLEDARMAYEAFLALRPEDARAKVRLGRVLVLLGRPEEAIPPLESGLGASLDVPHRLVGRLCLGDAVRRSGDVEASIGHYRRALDSVPGSQRAAVALSHALRQLGRDEESRAVIERSFTGFDLSDPLWDQYLLAEAHQQSELWTELRGRLR